MGKAQGKKAAPAGRKSAVKQVVSRVKKAAGAAKKKALPKKPSPGKAAVVKPAKKAGKPQPKPVPRKPAPMKKTKTPAAKAVVSKRGSVKPAGKPAARAKKAVASVRTIVKKAAARSVKAVTKPKKQAKIAKAVPSARAAALPSAVPPSAKPARKARKSEVVALAPVPASPAVAAAPGPVAEPEKKRGRRARTRIHSNGAPAAAWLTSEKPRSASFIPAPPRAEAPAAIAAPPASSDRLIRPEDVEQSDVRTVPVRVDIEQGAGRFYVLPNPTEVTVRAGEVVEWDFRYLGGADVTVEEIVVEFEKPSPFQQAVFRTRKPGGARPHRQLSDRAVPSAAGSRVEYTLRAMNGFKTEVSKAKAWLTVIA